MILMELNSLNSAAEIKVFTFCGAYLTCFVVTLYCVFRNLLVNLGLFAAGVWVARNLSDFDLMAPQPVT